MKRSEFLRSLGLSSGALMAVYCLGGLTACSKEEGTPAPDPRTAPGSKVDVTLDLNSATYSKLNTNGQFEVLTAQPIIVARKNDGGFVALSKECTHQGTTLNFQAANDRFNCVSHGSNFSTTGSVLNGPANAPLKQYKTTFNSTANTLRVYED